MNLFWTLNCDFHVMSFSNSVQVSKNTVHSRCKCLSSSFDFLPQLDLWFRLLHYHYSNKQTLKYTCITLYSYTVHSIIRTRAQSVRRQHKKRNLEESKILTYRDTTQALRHMWPKKGELKILPPRDNCMK